MFGYVEVDGTPLRRHTNRADVNQRGEFFGSEMVWLLREIAPADHRENLDSGLSHETHSRIERMVAMHECLADRVRAKSLARTNDIGQFFLAATRVQGLLQLRGRDHAE